ncbi:8163_t:CDS:2, partial [Racocetra persica]
YNLSDEVFSLDITSSFSTVSPPFTDLYGISRMLFERTAVSGGVNKDDVYLAVGTLQDLILLNRIDHNETITDYSLLR